MVLGFSLADMMNHIDCFMSVELALHPGDKSHLVMMYNLFNVLDAVSSYFVEDFCIDILNEIGL